MSDGIIGTIKTYDKRTNLQLQHSSNAVVQQFWLRIKPIDKRDTAVALTIPDCRVLIALLEKGIKEAEEE